MKLQKNASGKKFVKMSRSEWIAIGKKAGFLKVSEYLNKSFDLTIDAEMEDFLNAIKFLQTSKNELPLENADYAEIWSSNIGDPGPDYNTLKLKQGGSEGTVVFTKKVSGF